MNRRTITRIAISVAVIGLFVLLTAGSERLRDQSALAIVLQTALLVGAVYLLGAGAGILVDSSARLARRWGISELVIGLTVVAFGTSAPELAASLVAGFEGVGNVAIGNVIGSNIFNLCFILGGVALLSAGGVSIDRELIRRDGPTVLLGTLLVFVFLGSLGDDNSILGLFNLRLDFFEGVLLTLGLCGYLLSLYRARRSGRHGAQAVNVSGSTSKDIALVVISLAMVLGGSHLLVGIVTVTDNAVQGFGAVWFATIWGVPDYVIGLTVIAAGTSAPELVVSLAAAARGETDMSVGNLLGSVVFNLFGVLGAAGLFVQPPLADSVLVSLDIVPHLIGLSVLLVVIILFMMTGRRITRWEGSLLVLIGAAFWVADFITRGRF